MAITRVQFATAHADPGSATFASTPAQGNLLVAIAAERSGNSESLYTISGSGWTKVVARDVLLTDGNSRRNLAIWWKVAGASEPTNISIDNGTTSTKRATIIEFNDSAGGTWTFKEKADADSGTGSTSPQSTGTTASVANGTLLVLGVAGWRAEETTHPTSVGWTNSLTDIQTQTSDSFSKDSGFAWKETATGGTFESEVSWTGAGCEVTAAILVFDAVAAGGAPTYSGWYGHTGWF